jgi:uncharacterized protein (TIGR02996 family)
MPTDERRALWAAIRAHPDEDTPRLVFADWLQEHGDEARAEFIRLQCQIARLPDDHKTRRKVRPGLEHRERVLSTANREHWAEPLFRILTRPGPGTKLESWVLGVRFRRGFVSGLQLDLDGAHRVTTAGPDLEPLDDLAVSIWHRNNPKKLAEVFASEAAGCIVRFMLRGAADDGVAAVVAGAHTRLKHLSFALGEVTDAGATALAQWPRAAGLVSLNLVENRIGDRGAEALADSPHLGGLAELNLERNRIGPHARRKLVLRFGGNVLLGPEPV